MMRSFAERGAGVLDNAARRVCMLPIAAARWVFEGAFPAKQNRLDDIGAPMPSSRVSSETLGCNGVYTSCRPWITHASSWSVRLPTILLCR